MKNDDRQSKLHHPLRGGGMIGDAARGMRSPAIDRWPGSGKADEWRWRGPVGWAGHAGRSLSRMLRRCGASKEAEAATSDMYVCWQRRLIGITLAGDVQ